MVAELVVRVAVHLGEVLPIEGVEPGRFAQGGLDERSVAVEMDEPAIVIRRHLPEHRSGHRVTPRPSGRRSRRRPAGGGRSRRSGPSAGRRPRRDPRRRARRSRHRRRALGRRSSARPGSSSRTGRPLVSWRATHDGGVEAAAAEADRPRLEPGHERLEQRVAVDRPPARGLAQAGHRPGQLGREVGRRPVGVHARSRRSPAGRRSPGRPSRRAPRPAWPRRRHRSRRRGRSATSGGSLARRRPAHASPASAIARATIAASRQVRSGSSQAGR